MNDEEVGRWQHAIYEACVKTVKGLREERLIDGAGEDSGDPLDFSLAEISLAFCSLHDEIDLLTRERDDARKRLGRLWRWVAARACAKPTEEPCETTQGGFKMVDCGECLPCEARKALSFLTRVEAALEVKE